MKFSMTNWLLQVQTLLDRAHLVVERCDCEDGCTSCESFIIIITNVYIIICDRRAKYNLQRCKLDLLKGRSSNHPKWASGPNWPSIGTRLGV